MMNYLGALSAGYTVEQILNYLSETFPELSSRIKEAVQSGKNPKDILKYLSQFDRNKLSIFNGNKKGKSVFPEQISDNPYIQSTENIKQYDPIPQSIKTGAKLGATALGGYALSRALPKIAQQVSPQLLQEPIGNISVPSPSKSTLPSTPSMMPVKNILDKYEGFSSKIEDLLQIGNGPKEIEAYFLKFNPSQSKKMESELGKPLIEIINDYISQSKQNVLEKNEKKQESEKKQAMLPSGDIGEIESIKNGIAKINVNGQEKHRKLDEIVESPLNEKDLATLYSDLIKGIEKESNQQVSRNVYWAGYDPKTNELAYLPHDGGFYIYDQISPDDAKELTNILNKRKSTGQNYIGAWTEGSKSPIGAAMYQLIQKLQKERGGKGKEYLRKFEKIYDALELAKIKLKKKHEEEKKKTKKSRID